MAQAMDAAVLAQSHQNKRAQFLDGFAEWQQFAEDFVSLGNGWLLLLSTGVSLYALMLDVHNTSGVVLFAWALAQIFGVDLQFFVGMVRARAAYAQGRYGAMFLWVCLALILAIAIWQALYAFSVENATGLTEAQVFQQWGMSLYVWLGWRAFLVILLMGVAAITRHSRTITDAHIAAATVTATSPVAPNPTDGPGGGLPATPAASQRDDTVPMDFAPAHLPANLGAQRTRRQPVVASGATRDPRTARTSAQNAELRAQREAFAQHYFAEHPDAGPTDLASALGIKSGGTVQRLWEKYGNGGMIRLQSA